MQKTITLAVATLRHSHSLEPLARRRRGRPPICPESKLKSSKIRPRYGETRQTLSPFTHETLLPKPLPGVSGRADAKGHLADEIQQAWGDWHLRAAFWFLSVNGWHSAPSVAEVLGNRNTREERPSRNARSNLVPYRNPPKHQKKAHFTGQLVTVPSPPPQTTTLQSLSTMTC